MGDTEKKVSVWLSLKDGISAGVDKLSRGWNSSIAAMKTASIGFAAVFAGTVAGIYQGIKAYGEQAEAASDLEAAMKNAGTFSAEASQDLQNYASEMQKVTRYSDEQITSAQAMIASFGFQGKQLKSLTDATMDLATAKKMDLQSAADLVAKSVGGETNALGRYGIKIEGVAGSTERASAAIDGIARLFNGRAQASALTFAGSIDRIKNQVGEIVETVGKPFVDFLTTLIGQFASGINKITPWITEHAKLIAVIAGVVAGLAGLMTALSAIVTIAPTIAAAWMVITGPIGLTIAAIAGLTAATVYFSTSQSKLAENVRAVWDGVRGIFTGNIQKIKDAWSDLSESAKKHNEKLAAILAERAAKEAAAVQKAADDAKIAQERKEAAERSAYNKKIFADKEYNALKADLDAANFAMSKKMDDEKKIYEQMTAEERLKYLQEYIGQEQLYKNQQKIDELMAEKNFEEARKTQNQMYSDAYLASVKKKNEAAKKENEQFDKYTITGLLIRCAEELKNEKLTADQKRMIAEAYNNFLVNAQVLMRSKSYEMFIFGKRISQANALVSAYLGATQAFAAMSSIPYVGPVLGGIAAAAAIAAGLENVRQIEDVQFQAREGAYVRGSSGGVIGRFGEDNRSEMVLPVDDPEAMGKIRDALGLGNNTINLVMDGNTLATWYTKATMKQFLLQREGRLPNNA